MAGRAAQGDASYRKTSGRRVGGTRCLTSMSFLSRRSSQRVGENESPILASPRGLAARADIQREQKKTEKSIKDCLKRNDKASAKARAARFHATHRRRTHLFSLPR